MEIKTKEECMIKKYGTKKININNTKEHIELCTRSLMRDIEG